MRKTEQWTSGEPCMNRHMQVRKEETFMVLMNWRESIVGNIVFIQLENHAAQHWRN